MHLQATSPQLVRQYKYERRIINHYQRGTSTSYLDSRLNVAVEDLGTCAVRASTRPEYKYYKYCESTVPGTVCSRKLDCTCTVLCSVELSKSMEHSPHSFPKTENRVQL